MYVVSVTIRVHSQFTGQFKAAILDNASNSRKEPGNLRFDVLQDEADPTRFMLYEVYRTKEDFAVHQQQPHYFRWRDAVTDWMAEPRQATKLHTVFYGDGEA